jgi:hypothetical protein
MLDDVQQTAIGLTIIGLLGLRIKRNGRVDTSWGDKTPRGLYLSLERIINRVEETA